MELTKNFSLDEFKVSSVRPDLAKKIEFTDADKVKIFLLCKYLLQPIRDKFGRVIILSGKRSEELNSDPKVKGSPTSDHLFNEETCAVDFTCPDANMKEVYEWIVKNRIDVIGQVIRYRKSLFIHVSLASIKHYQEHWEWDK